MDEVYQPREDSQLILDQVKKYSKGKVLDIGTGTGILAINAALKADFVYGIDINPKAIQTAKKAAKGIKNIQFIKSNLFSYFKKNKETFDLITFNPPYLPEDKNEPKSSRLATTGGKKGYELLQKFLEQASFYLNPDGKILILFSSLTNPEKVHELIEDHGFHYHKLAEQSFFFETLFVYLLEKSDFLIELEDYGISNISRLTKGHRGLIYTGKYNKKIVAIKTKNPKSEAIGRIYNEARWLKLLNKYKIGPKLIMHDKEYFIYHFVKGIFIEKFLETNSKTKIKQILIDIFNQCYTLDKMQVSKEEMHHPYKHIVIDKKPVMLDFERTHKTLKPQNTTQFCQYVISGNITRILKKKGINLNKRKIISAASKYKKQPSEDNFQNIINNIQ